MNFQLLLRIKRIYPPSASPISVRPIFEMCVDDVLMEFGFGLEWTRVAVIPSAEKRLRHFGLDVQM